MNWEGWEAMQGKGWGEEGRGGEKGGLEVHVRKEEGAGCVWRWEGRRSGLRGR